MVSPNISEIASTTIESRTGKLADNVSENSMLLKEVRKAGNVKPFSGGNVIRQELAYQENQGFRRYSGLDLLDVSGSDVITSAEFNIKQAAVPVVISGLEEIQNAGKEQIIDLLEGRIDNAEATLLNNIASDCYSDGTANSSKQIGGLQHLVADDPTTGTVGGINRATWTFWRSVVVDASSVTGTTFQASNAYDLMERLWVQLCRNSDKPNFISADNVYFRAYKASLVAGQQFVDSAKADGGFQTIAFNGCPVVLDGGYGGACPASHLYMLNTKYLHFRPHAKRNFVPLKNDRYAVNQDAMVKHLVFAGNMTLSCGFLQGVIIA